MSLWKWSQTAASNATADASINWAEGQAPSSVNDSARAMMAATAKYRDDISGAITTGGTSTAYTVASNQSFDTLAHLHNQQVAFVPHTTNGEAPTLAVDGLTAKSLCTAPGVNVAVGRLVLGSVYVFTYNNADGAFYLQNGGAPVVLSSRVAADVTYQSTITLAAVTGLSVNLSAGRTYAIDVWLAVDGGGVAAGAQAALSGTATITNLIAQGTLVRNNGLVANGTVSAFDTAIVSENGGDANIMIIIKGTITVNAAGTLIVTAAQDTSSIDIMSVKRGSWLIATDIT